MKISLIILPAWTPETCPLGIAYISAICKNAGYDTKTHDYNVELWNTLRSDIEDDPKDWWSSGNYRQWEYEDEFMEQTFPTIKPLMDERVDEIIAEDPDVVGFSLFSTSIHSSRYFAQELRKKKTNIKIIYGGAGCIPANVSRDVKEGICDYAIYGEGESTMMQILEAIDKGEEINKRIATGILSETDEGQVIKNLPTPNLDMKDLPMPDFSDFDLDTYRYKKLPIMMSRGCVAQCSFCGEVRFWYKFRMRPAEHIMEEFRQDFYTYGIRDYAVNDSLINGNMRILAELIDLMIAEKRKTAHLPWEEQFDIWWGGYARVDKRQTDELLAKLYEAGCRYLSFGVESGSQRVLDLMKKNATVEEAYRTIQATGKAGIEVILNIIIGYPNEERMDFIKTMKMIYDNHPYIHNVCSGETLGIHDDTPLYDNPELFGIKANENGHPMYDEDGNWISADGRSTAHIRRRRLMIFRTFLDILDQKWSPAGMANPRFMNAKDFKTRFILNPVRMIKKWAFGLWIFFNVPKIDPAPVRATKKN